MGWMQGMCMPPVLDSHVWETKQCVGGLAASVWVHWLAQRVQRLAKHRSGAGFPIA